MQFLKKFLNIEFIYFFSISLIILTLNKIHFTLETAKLVLTTVILDNFLLFKFTKYKKSQKPKLST